MPPSASPRIEGTQTGYSTLANERTVSTPHKANVLTVPTPHEASIEELRARTLPPTHPRLADVLDGVFGARFGVAANVERVNARCTVF